MYVKKTLITSNLILCILVYIIKLKEIWKKEHNGEEMDKNTERLLFMKKLSEMGIDLVSKNFGSFFMKILPHSHKIFHSIKQNKFIKFPKFYKSKNQI